MKVIFKESEVIIEVVLETKSSYAIYLVLLGIQKMGGNELEIECFHQACRYLPEEDLQQLIEAQTKVLKFSV